jgi:uncharacterized membrane protein YhaH (DUF805 family)
MVASLILIQLIDFLVIFLLLAIAALGVLYFAVSLNIVNLHKKTLYFSIIVLALLVAVVVAIEKGPNVDLGTFIILKILFVFGLIILLKSDDKKNKKVDEYDDNSNDNEAGQENGCTEENN